MFRRVTPEQWSQITAMIGFALTFAVFAGAVFRAWRMRRDHADEMARLPLDSDRSHPDPSHE